MSTIEKKSIYAALLAGALFLPLSACQPKYPTCKNDKNCRAGEFCVNGRCQKCRSDKDCGAGQTCRSGRCEVKATNRCSDDADCPANQSCIDGTCRPCDSDDQCGTGGKCQNGRCQRAQSLPPSAGPGECSPESIYFEFNDSNLTGGNNSIVEKNTECAKSKKRSTVTLTGYTDPRGTEEYNLALSDRRAQSVRSQMIRLGYEGSKIRVIPKGKLEATGTDESSWTHDRRVDTAW